MRIATLIILSGLVAVPAAAAAMGQETSPVVVAETDVQAFRRLRAEAVAAAGAQDLTTAASLLAQADALIPGHAGLILLRARIAVMAGQDQEALAQVRRYARAGLTLDLARDRTLSALAEAPGFAQAAEALEANRARIGEGRLAELARIQGAVIVESLVRDDRRERWLVSQVRGRTIIALADDGTVSDFLRPDPGIGGVLGMAVDVPADVLWAATSPAPPAVHGLDARAERPAPGLLKIDLASGEVLARFGAPAGPPERGFGDIVRAADGAVHVADSTTGEILTLEPDGAALTVLLPTGALGSPQGMAVTPDGAALIVADYSSGLWRVERKTGAARRLSAPADASLVGVDGLAADGQVIYALQNGVNPHRVLRLTLDAGWTRIQAVEVMAANMPIIDEPTTGLVRNDELVFVSRSQWSDFGGDGAQTTLEPAPGVIARLPLD